jgi:hypothetical protein
MKRAAITKRERATSSGRRWAGTVNFGFWILDFGLLLARVGCDGFVEERWAEERVGVLLAGEVEARDLPPSILDQVGGVDLVCLGGAFFAAEDWGIDYLCTAYCVLLSTYCLLMRGMWRAEHSRLARMFGCAYYSMGMMGWGKLLLGKDG